MTVPDQIFRRSSRLIPLGGKFELSLLNYDDRETSVKGQELD